MEVAPSKTGEVYRLLHPREEPQVFTGRLVERLDPRVEIRHDDAVGHRIDDGPKLPLMSFRPGLKAVDGQRRLSCGCGQDPGHRLREKSLFGDRRQ